MKMTRKSCPIKCEENVAALRIVTVKVCLLLNFNKIVLFQTKLDCQKFGLTRLTMDIKIYRGDEKS